MSYYCSNCNAAVEAREVTDYVTLIAPGAWYSGTGSIGSHLECEICRCDLYRRDEIEEGLQVSEEPKHG